MSDPLLRVEKLRKYFPVTKGILFPRTTGWIKAVDDVSFSIGNGETFALIGESGCGKSTTAKLILLLSKPTGGSIRFEGNEILGADGARRWEYRRSVQTVFQDPTSSLNSRMRVGSIVAEPIIVNEKMSGKAIRERVNELLNQVGLPASAVTLFPHEFSGGQRQRIALARAIALNPKLVVLDEPVSALDVSIGAQIMNLLKDLQQKLGISYLLIAHNLATVRYMSHHVGIMYLGRIVEHAPSNELFTRPVHPYTRALISAALPSHPDVQKEEIVLQGEVPSPMNVPPGCRFNTRCPDAQGICLTEDPSLKQVGAQHWVACHIEQVRTRNQGVIMAKRN